MRQNNNINKGIDGKIARLEREGKETNKKLCDLNNKISYLKALKRNANIFSLGNFNCSRDKSSIMPYLVKIIGSIEQDLDDDLSFTIIIPTGYSDENKTVMVIIGKKEVIEIIKLINWDEFNIFKCKDTIHTIIDNFNSLGFQLTVIEFENVKPREWLLSGLGANTYYNVITTENISTEFPYLQEFLERLTLLRLEHETFDIEKLNNMYICEYSDYCHFVDEEVKKIIEKYRNKGDCKKRSLNNK